MLYDRFEELLQELKKEHERQLEANHWEVDQLLMQNSFLKNRVAKLQKELEIRNAPRDTWGTDASKKTKTR